jgi:exosortase O
MMDWYRRIPISSKLAIMLANLGLAAGWVWLYRGVYPYLGVIFTRQEFRTNQILLIGVITLIVLQYRKGTYRLRIDCSPGLYPPALGLVLICSVSFLLVERYLDINTFSASLFGLATYGLLGLWMQPRTWRNGLPAIILLVGVLPFGEHLQTFVGYPVRLITAEIVRAGLVNLGVQEFSSGSQGVNTILVFESGMTKVDLPCSGVQSLWTGGLFLIAATWIEGRRINPRWILIAVLYSLFLLLANLGRVAVLVAVGQVIGWRLAAEMLHIPLGVLGFVSACLGALFLLRWAGGGATDAVGTADQVPPKRPAWLTPALIAAVLVMAFLYAPRQEAVMAESGPAWQFPENMSVRDWPMGRGELEWLNKAGIHSAKRWRFQWQGFDSGSASDVGGDLSGSILLVSSQTWREHHRPEACFEVYGFSVDQSFSTLVDGDFPVRVLSLGDGGITERSTAVYWLQSAETTTDEYATRIWADLQPERQRWVLITVLFDESIDHGSDNAVHLFQALQTMIAENLEGGNS